MVDRGVQDAGSGRNRLRKERAMNECGASPSPCGGDSISDSMYIKYQS